MPDKKKIKAPAIQSQVIIETKPPEKIDEDSLEGANTADSTPLSFPVVGIGASAGGLSAFEAFFSGMPDGVDPGMAFVLVQHLAPDHKSILSELIRRYTRMDVFEVEDAMVVKPNCTYIIPPNRDMAFLSGALHLLEPAAPRGQRMPIDFFFRSLAQDQHERAIGIILSGTGSDGTLGVRDIKGQGGMVMAQAPQSTEYDGMPCSALATGLVDYELPPAEMASQLIAYVQHAITKPARPEPAPSSSIDHSLQRIYILLRNSTSHDFSGYKPKTIQRRIERRMAIHQVTELAQYVKYLQQTPAEAGALFRDLLIGVTNFFRDPEAFKVLEENIIPQLFAGKEKTGTIRIWCAGCSTGEEAYSLAILLAEFQEKSKQTYKIQIFATDIDNQAIDTARAGIYPASISTDITPERLARFFILEPDGISYRIHKNVRDMLIFSIQSVIKDPPFSKIDLISCRNLLIYLSSSLQKKLIPLFQYALNSKGILFLGNSETIGEFSHLFGLLDTKWKIYQRIDSFQVDHRLPIDSFQPSQTIQEAGHMSILPHKTTPVKIPLRELTERTLIRQVAPVAALVTALGDLLYIHGRTGAYLEPVPGEVGTANILKMARPGLQRELTVGLRKSVAGQKLVRYRNLHVETNGHLTVADLTIHRVVTDCDGNPMPPLFLVILQEISALDQEHDLKFHKGAMVSGPASAQTDDKLDRDSRIEALLNELQAKEEFLQSSSEELETANDELKSFSEEMQSANEELQSSNEELETSKEELQSINEELATVNAELQNKVTDLRHANNDMNNLLAGTGIGTVFVDTRLKILRFTPAATKIINLINSDIGRPVGHIVANFTDYSELLEDAQSVLDSLTPKELEVQTTAGLWYTMRITPYRTIDNVIEGAVLTFVDITATKLAEDELRRAHYQIAESIVNTLREPLLVLNSTLELISANDAFFTTFQVNPEDSLGQKLYSLGNGQWNIKALRRLLEKILPTDTSVTNFKVSHTFETIGPRTMLLNARRMVDRKGNPELILLAIDDITDQSGKGAIHDQPE